MTDKDENITLEYRDPEKKVFAALSFMRSEAAFVQEALTAALASTDGPELDYTLPRPDGNGMARILGPRFIVERHVEQMTLMGLWNE